MFSSATEPQGTRCQALEFFKVKRNVHSSVSFQDVTPLSKRTALLDHERRVHGSELWTCPICAKQFKNNFYITHQHIRRNHKIRLSAWCFRTHCSGAQNCWRWTTIKNQSAKMISRKWFLINDLVDLQNVMR